MINSNYLAPFSHDTSLTDKQTNGRTTTTTAQPLLKYGRLKGL